MTTHHTRRDYSDYSAAELRQAAQRISADLARAQEMAGAGGIRPEAVEEQQDLQKWMRNEAGRRI
jgi:putative N-acetylmannosamine-6-phosphate epimerase